MYAIRSYYADIIKACGEANVLPSSTNPTRPYTVNTVDQVAIDRLAQEKADVITSYSIHYTKLYDRLQAGRDLADRVARRAPGHVQLEDLLTGLGGRPRQHGITSYSIQ